MKAKRTTQAQRLKTATVLLTVVVVCLVAMLTQVDRRSRPDLTRDHGDGLSTRDQPSDEATLPEAAPVPETPPVSEVEPDGAEKTGAESVLSAPEPQESHEEGEAVATREIFLVIDDVGNNLAHLDSFLALDLPLTYAVLPGRRYSAESVARIREEGQGLILHQPMEPLGDADPGYGAILTGMTRAEVFGILENNIAELPGVTGINNHMGSRVTADAITMSYVMEFLSEQRLFFLDSYTTNGSVAAKTAERYAVPFVKRTGLFLDNQQDYDSIRNRVREGLVVAEEAGSVILIGHVQTGELARLLGDLAGELIQEGYTFRWLSEYPAVAAS